MAPRCEGCLERTDNASRHSTLTLTLILSPALTLTASLNAHPRLRRYDDATISNEVQAMALERIIARKRMMKECLETTTYDELAITREIRAMAIERLQARDAAATVTIWTSGGRLGDSPADGAGQVGVEMVAPPRTNPHPPPPYSATVEVSSLMTQSAPSSAGPTSLARGQVVTDLVLQRGGSEQALL